MAYDTGLLSRTLEDIDGRVARIRRDAQSIHDKMLGIVTSQNIIDWYTIAADHWIALNKAKDVPGIAEYARTQKNKDPTYDIVVEFQAVMTALDAVMDEIETTFPNDGTADKWLTAVKFAPLVEGQSPIEQRQFSTAATASLRSLLLALVSTIN